MNITMLGTSGSGKTSYLSAISGLFWHGNYHNYTLQPQNTDLVTRARINSELERISTLYTKGQFPDGTAKTTKLRLELNHDNFKVVDVNWIDYRGGEVDNLAKNEIEPEKSKLYAAILQSDAIMVFVDASLVKAWGDDSLAMLRYKIGANYIEPLLEHASQHKSLNVIFVLSKSDSGNINIAEDESMLKRKVREIYSRYFNRGYPIFNDEYIIPIGVVGLNNSIIEGVDADCLPVKHGIINVRKLKTYHVAASFAQALLLCLQSARNSTESNINSLARELKILEDQMGDSVVKNIIDNFFNGSKKRTEIFEIKQKIQNNKNEILRLSSHEKDLRNMASSPK